MMNLELLCKAGDLFGNGWYWDIAVNHADHTAQNHLRPDSKFSMFLTVSAYPPID